MATVNSWNANENEPFNVSAGEKQGCVINSAIFNLHLINLLLT